MKKLLNDVYFWNQRRKIDLIESAKDYQKFFVEWSYPFLSEKCFSHFFMIAKLLTFDDGAKVEAEACFCQKNCSSFRLSSTFLRFCCFRIDFSFFFLSASDFFLFLRPEEKIAQKLVNVEENRKNCVFFDSEVNKLPLRIDRRSRKAQGGT